MCLVKSKYNQYVSDHEEIFNCQPISNDEKKIVKI